MLNRKIKVPIPDDGRMSPDGVVVQVRHIPGERWPQKKRIGKVPIHEPDYREEDYLTADGVRLMIPNDNYRREYKDEFQAYLDSIGARDEECTAPDAISVGLYLLTLGVAYQLEIYQLLCDEFSIEFANAALDLATYLIACSSDADSRMRDRLRDQMLFSAAPLPDSWYSETLQDDAMGHDPAAMFGERRVREFIKRWVQRRMASGSKAVYLTLDGSGLGCLPLHSTETAQGHADMGKKTDQVAIVTAVEASGDNQGMPLAYVIEPGGLSELTTAQELRSLFTGMGLDIQELLADGEFPCEDVLALCDGLHIPFLMTAKSNTDVFRAMFERYGKEIFWNERYWIQGTDNCYGITDFPIAYHAEKSKNPARDVCAGLFFEGTLSRIERAKDKETLNVELRRIDRRLEEFNQSGMIDQALQTVGENAENSASREAPNAKTDEEKVLAALKAAKISVTADYKDVLELKYDDSAKKVYRVLHRDVLGKRHETIGFFCMVSSVPKTAQEMAEEYKIKDISGKVFRSKTTQLGSTTSQTSGDCSFHGTFFFCFIAEIIRNEVVRLLQRYERKEHISIDINDMILSFSGIEYTRSGSGYIYAGETTLPQREILGELGIGYHTLKELGPVVSRRITQNGVDKLRSERRAIPILPESRGPGRPAGSKNKPKDKARQDNDSSKAKAKRTSKGKQKDAKSGEDPTASDPKTPEVSKEMEKPEDSKSKAAAARELSPDEVRKQGISKDPQPEESKSPDGDRDGSGNDTTLKQEAAAKTPEENGETGADLPKEKASRVGTVYKTTLRQEALDRKLSEETGIDIIGNPPPRPWSNAFRAAENRRRARLRKLALAKRREMQASTEPEPEPDQ